MKLKTSVKSLAAIVKANVVNSIYRGAKPKKEGHQFLDLNVHLTLPTPEEVPMYLEELSSRADGVAIAHYGRVQSGIESYDNIIKILQEYAPDRFSIKNKGLVAVLKDHLKGNRTILFRSEEVDETQQNLDIMLIGYTDLIPNTAHLTGEYHDARKVAELGRKQGAFTYLQHFCVKPSYTIAQEKKNFLQKHLPWVIDTWKENREELFDIMDSVDAVETHNGMTVLYVAPQNAISQELMREYHKKRDPNKPVISCSNAITSLKAIGTAGILIPSLDASLSGREIIEQLRDNITKWPIYHKRRYHGLPLFIKQRLRLKKERERLKKQLA